MIKKILVPIFLVEFLTVALLSPLTNKVLAATNLIVNPSVETNTSSLPNNWLKDSWGTNSPTFTYQTNGQDGSRSLSVQIKTYRTGDAKWYFTPVAVTAGQAYTYSDYYKATVQTFLVAQTDNGSGNFNYFQIGNALATSSVWKNVTATFTVPTGVQSLTIFHLINKVGTLQTDNFSLSASSSPDPNPNPNPGPLVITDNVPNNSLEQNDGSQPLAWSGDKWGTNSPTFTYLDNLGHTGTHSVKTELTSYSSGDAKWNYTPQPTTPNSQWRFTDYYQANITSRVVVQITNKDNSQTYIELKTAPAAATWTKYSDFFTTPANAAKLTVFHLISQVGYLITDDYSVTPFVPAGFNRALVTLTFDDGFISHHDVALPMLQQYNFPATFYITTGFLGTSGYMTNQMIFDLKNAGEDIEDHTVTHPHLPTLTSTQVHNELVNSQTYLRNTFGVTANHFASPYGEVNDAVMTQVRTYFTSHRGVESGYNYKDSFDIYNLKVQNLLVTTTPAEVDSWLQQAASTHTWLILVFHQIYSGGDTYSSTPQNFANYLGLINQRALPVVTLDQALNEVVPQLSQ